MNQDTIQASQPVTSSQQMQAGMRELSERIRQWWAQEGLGYTSDISLTSGGHLMVKFSCSGSNLLDLPGDDLSLSEQEVEERILGRFERLGFTAKAVPGEGIVVFACDHSTAAMSRLLKETFPSCIITGADTRVMGHYGDAFIMLSAQVLIRNLDEVLVLPAPTKTT